ncbi:hypothetical protein JW930_07540 [Candidatus Woesearchaeota archaeon]|nr:hypothetical protein [Candidatus Woesearchaeota archaeon]
MPYSFDVYNDAAYCIGSAQKPADYPMPLEKFLADEKIRRGLAHRGGMVELEYELRHPDERIHQQLKKQLSYARQCFLDVHEIHRFLEEVPWKLGFIYETGYEEGRRDLKRIDEMKLAFHVLPFIGPYRGRTVESVMKQYRADLETVLSAFMEAQRDSQDEKNQAFRRLVIARLYPIDFSRDRWISRRTYLDRFYHALENNMSQVQSYLERRGLS